MKFLNAWLAGQILVAAALFLTGTSIFPVQAEEADTDIDLKLFRKEDLPANPTGCHFALWQSNRDPETDIYSYLFFVPFSENGEPLPARIKVGNDFIELNQIAQSQADNPEQTVDGLQRHHVYRSDNPRYRVLIELLKGGGGGSMVRIEDADIYVIRSHKFPFLASAKGEYGCPEPEGTSGGTPLQLQDTRPRSVDKQAKWSGPDGIPFGPPRQLTTIDEIPAVLRAELRKYASEQCDLENPPPWPGASYVVNDAYMLWEVPCFAGAYQASSVFGVTQNPPRDWAELLVLQNPPAHAGETNYGVMNAQVFNDQGIIRSTNLGRGIGDCGVHQVIRLIDGPGETIEFELLEYREKIDCDGKTTIPEDWPLVYKGY